MFYSNYLPVNIKRDNAAIHTVSHTYPIKLLEIAHNALVNNNNADNKVVITDGVVTFTEHPEHSWTIQDIYLAWEAYITADKNNFSFYTVCNPEGLPQLYVSKSFKNHRILVSALTLRSVLVSKQNLVRKISCMIDKKFSNIYCMDLYNTIESLESGSTKFLDAIIVNRDTDEEFMAVSPITTMYTDNTLWYAKDLTDEFRAIMDNPELVTESLKLEDGNFVRVDLSPGTWLPMPLEHVDNIIKLYDKLLDKKNNYLPICGDDYDTHFYISTNWRYLVRARTFEVVTIKSMHMKRLLQSYATASSVSVAELELMWMLAKTE